MQLKLRVPQSEAIKHGQNRYGVVDVEVDIAALTEQERGEIANRIVRSNDNSIYSPSDTTEGSLIYLRAEMAAEAAKVARQKQEHEAEVQQILSADDAWLVDHYFSSTIQADPRIKPAFARQRRLQRERRLTDDTTNIINNTPTPSSILWGDDHKNDTDLPNYAAYLAAVKDWKERQAKVIADANAKAAADKATEERKRQQIASWVERQGSDSQRRRLAAGLLPRQEILDAMRDQALVGLQGQSLYEPLTASDISEHEETCTSFEATFRSYVATEADSETFERFEFIRAAAPPLAVVKLREHVGTCSSCEATATRYGIIVEIVVGEFTFRREYMV